MITNVRAEQTMRAVVQDRYGSPNVLTLAGHAWSRGSDSNRRPTAYKAAPQR